MSSYIRRTDTLQSLKVHNLIPEGSTGGIEMRFTSTLNPPSVFTISSPFGSALFLSPYNYINDFNNITKTGDAIISFTSANTGLAITPNTTGSATGIRMDVSGNVGIATSNPTATLDVAGTFAIAGTTYSPLTATSPGVTGQITWGNDSGTDYIYVCTGTDTWVRAALSSW